MIDDGYTLSHSIDGLTFEYRPLIARERSLLDVRLRLYDSQCALRIGDNVLAGHILEWSYSERPSGWKLLELRHDRPLVWAGLRRAVLGIEPRFCEAEDAENLAAGVRLQVLYPHAAESDCDYCKAWWYDPISGETTQRGGLPVARQPHHTLLCETVGPEGPTDPPAGGCPKGTPEKPLSLSPKNRRALNHYLECRASVFPDDAIVRHNARIIRRVLDQIEHERRQKASRRLAG